MDVSPSDLGVRELLDSYRSGTLSPVGAVKAMLDRIETLDGELNAIATVAGEPALEAARESERRWVEDRPRLLEGVPFGIKDTILTAGIRTTFGSQVWSDFVPRADATVVARLRSAGAIPLIKTHANELGFGGVANPHHGTVVNPLDRTRSTGGSSAGSAAAVAAGYVPLALGTDSGGSVRSPAAFCGIVGMKPSNGRVPTDGIVVISPTLDCAGPMVRSVEDTRLALTVLVGGPPVDWQIGSSALAGRRVLVPWGSVTSFVEPVVEATFQRAIERLEMLGAVIDDGEIEEDLDHAWAVGWVIMLSEGATMLGGVLARWEEFDPALVERLVSGLMIDPGDYLAAAMERARMHERFLRLFDRFDLLALPTCPTLAPTLDESKPGSEPRRVELATRFTLLANVLGAPAISIPCETSQKGGLPVGLQLLAAPGREDLLLECALTFEKALTGALVAPSTRAAGRP
jgi:aspartyl-tRNA(Asn)/glutamyl-tRNA(Gln) amidotransferase subunit A